MPLNHNDGDGIDALDQNQNVNRWQFSVASGCNVSPGTDDLTVQCASGEIIFNGSTVSVSAQDNVGLDAPDATLPRKDVVYLDSGGTLRVATGTPEPAQPSDQSRQETYRPAPPDLSATDAVVLAEIWVPGGASDIAAADVRDRRQLADLAAGSLATGDVTDATSGNTVYDSAAEEVTADVNNESVSTDDLLNGDRNADVVLESEGSFPETTRAIGPDSVIAEGTDAGAVIQTVLNTFGPAYIVATQGSYQFSTSVTISDQGVRIEGTDPASTTFRANASLDQLFEVRKSGVRLVNGPVFQYFNVAGANQLTNFLDIDSSRFGLVRKINPFDLTGHVFRAESSESGNIDYWTFEDVLAFDCAGLFDAYSGAGGSFADNHIHRCHVERNTDWGVILRDGSRNELIEVFAGDNQNDMPGTVRLLDAGQGCEENDIIRPGLENQTGTSSAVCVQVEQQSGSGNSAKENHIERARATGDGTVAVNLVAGDPGGTRSTHITDVRDVTVGSTAVSIDANSANNKVNLEFETFDPDSVVSDSGIRTVINGWGTNAGDPRSTGDWNGNVMQGVTVRDTTNGVSYVGIGGSWVQV